MKTLVKIFVLTLFTLATMLCTAQIGTEATQALWKGMGGKEKWDSTNYILFTATGNSDIYLQSDRTFLINKKSGQVRFEGKSNEGNNLAVFFNFKSGKLSKFYHNGNELTDIDEILTGSFEKIKEQLRKDATLLFIASLIDMPDTKTGTITSKIVNAEKLQMLPFELKNNEITGEVLFNKETGYIKQIITKDKGTYYVNGYKDIGGGIFLPTIFKNTNTSDKSITFSTVAAFSDMEDSKFTKY